MSRFNYEMSRLAKRSAALHSRRQTLEEQHRIESERNASQTNAFLKSANAQPTPALVYAVWLYTFVEQGGTIRCSSSSNYEDSGIMVADGTYACSRRWMLTANTALFIPAGYGASALEIMVLPDLVEVNLRPSTKDHRQGWEWGHTDVMTLSRGAGPNGLCATTNDPDAVTLYPDVQRIIEGDMAKLISDCEERLRIRAGQGLSLRQ